MEGGGTNVNVITGCLPKLSRMTKRIYFIKCVASFFELTCANVKELLVVICACVHFRPMFTLGLLTILLGII